LSGEVPAGYTADMMIPTLLVSALLAALPAPTTDLPAPKAGAVTTRTAVFAAGCFWCVEAVFEALDGVSAVESGYAGGTAENAHYDQVSAGKTDHAEAVRITYDPAKVSYASLLHVLFSTHDPTTLNRQGPDWGRQYRTAIFYANDEEKKVAAAYVAQLGAAKAFKDPIVTTLEPLKAFFPAEDYHQDFVRKNPSHPYVTAWSNPKQEKVKTLFPQLLKKK